MNKRFFDLVDTKIPKHNPRIVEGYAVRSMKQAEGYVDRIIRSIAADFPPELKYDGFVRCTPYEEDKIITDRMNRQQANSNRGTFELSKSDFYLVHYKFSFHAPGQPPEELDPVYLYLPIVGDAGSITIHGSVFSIFPVMVDKGISVGPTGLFLRLNRVRLTFKAHMHHFMANGKRESGQAVWSEVYKGKIVKGAKNPVAGSTLLLHYMLAKYGALETFKRYAGAEVVFGDGLSVNTEQYPSDQWVICSSYYAAPTTLSKPSGHKKRQYTPPEIRIAMPRSAYTQKMIKMVAGFFYIADLFPLRVNAQDVNDTRLWQILLGVLLFGDTKTEGKIVEEMEAHMKALEEYMDAEARLQLTSAKIKVADVFELLDLIIENYHDLIQKSQTEFSSLYGKELSVLSYVLEDVAQSFTRLMFKMNAPKKKPFTKKDMNGLLRASIKPTLATNIKRDHIEVSNASTPGDNKYFTITSQVAIQTDASPARGKKASAKTDDPSNHLHASLAYVGSYSTMNKSDPTGKRKLNPYVHTDEHDTIVINPELEDVLERTQAMIKRRT